MRGGERRGGVQGRREKGREEGKVEGTGKT